MLVIASPFYYKFLKIFNANRLSNSQMDIPVQALSDCDAMDITMLQALFDNMSNGFALHEVIRDAQGKVCDYRYLKVNHAFETMTGFSKEKLLGNTIKTLLPNLEDYWLNNFAEVVDTGQPKNLENYAQGLKRWFWVYVYRPKLEQFAVLAQDISERKYAEEKLKLAALVYENSAEAMIVTDHLGVIMTVNPAFTRLTGYALNEVIGKTPSILKSGYHPPEFYRAIWDKINITGCWKGEIWNRRKNGEVYAEWLSINTIFNSDHSVYRRVALFSDITDQKESEHLIWLHANFDALTGLPNRSMFQDRLQQCIKKSHYTNSSLMLLFVGLDRFKEVNETLGHQVGDSLLKEVAKRLQNCLRESDTLARLGGDEFTIILTELQTHRYVEKITQEILRKISEPFDLQTNKIYLSASIGIAVYPNDAIESSELIKCADQAMYVAKKQGRNRYSYFAPFMQQAAKIRMRITNDLRNALMYNQFSLMYQPIVELATGVIAKAEVLIRWQHPLHGTISPDIFIPIAENNGMIVDIGYWVFQQAALQVALWRKKYHAHFQVSVNKSPIQFQSESHNHIEWIRYLHKLGLPGRSIVLEITEGLLMESTEPLIYQLLEFRRAGIQISLDDFGTGYSSLAYLKKFEIDYLKIDRSFVRHLRANSNDLALCEAIIVMAHKLGIRVIAEGIETSEQCELLTRAGCDYGQGYLFSKPIPSHEFESLITTLV
jgi:diguanylate cyclase (GGDEF)-like protein/PAS domain S-box-containing protein